MNILEDMIINVIIMGEELQYSLDWMFINDCLSMVLESTNVSDEQNVEIHAAMKCNGSWRTAPCRALVLAQQTTQHYNVYNSTKPRV